MESFSLTIIYKPHREKKHVFVWCATCENPDHAAQTAVTDQGLHYKHKMNAIILLKYYI